MSGYHLAVCIATVGRPEVLTSTILNLQAQTRRADSIFIAATTSNDISAENIPSDVQVIYTEKGLTRQRNALLNAASAADIVLFIDDDFILDSNYLQDTEYVYEKYSNIAMTTGAVILDGINGPGLTPEAAYEALHAAAFDRFGQRETVEIEEVHNAYGCNMSVNMLLARKFDVKFDVNLPLYGWQEDVDFSRQMANHGKTVKINSARGVHLGTKLGRVSGIQFGYSQIANPVYLLFKGSVGFRHVSAQISRNVLANILKLTLREPKVDRLGRLRGNLIAILDIIKNRSSPLRVLDL